jgi:ketosteroid isomerase-like protein
MTGDDKGVWDDADEAIGPYGNPGARQSEIDVVQGIYDAFARRDVEAALEFVSDDIRFFPTGTSELLGRSDPYVGKAGLREYFADVARVWDDITLHAESVRTAGNGVIVFGRVEATVDGAAFATRAIWIWQVRDGKAVEMRATPLGSSDDA